MSNTLHITNGDATIPIMRAATIEGDILPWRDVLHEGPVPAGLSLDDLSQVRAENIVSQGWGDAEAIKQDFESRDAQLKRYADYDEVWLWFEHDHL